MSGTYGSLILPPPAEPEWQSHGVRGWNLAQPYPPLIRTALMHAQFETIHPFLDDNGRTGRLLITLQLCHNKVLEHPILYLSDYFKRHRDSYFERLSDYHNKSYIDRWLIFFLEGVTDVA
jgi:Fic family protein